MAEFKVVTVPRGTCANGDGNPICPPSKVICRECMDRISENLYDILNDLRAQETEGGENDG